MTPKIPESLESKIEQYAMSSVMNSDDDENSLELNEFALNKILQLKGRMLSGGQRRKVEIA